MNAKTVKPAKRLEGELIIPGDKSISHRAAIFGTLAEGETHITHFLTAEDCLNTLAAGEQLGAKVERRGTEVHIQGCGREGLQPPQKVIDCGNSGTGVRLLTGVLAGQKFNSVITGDEQVQRRPMNRILEPLTRMGATIYSRPGGLCPLEIRGEILKQRAADLTAIEYHSPLASAQVKSCVLLAGLFAPGTTTVIEPDYSRDHTERLLRAFGVDCQEEFTLLAGGARGHKVSLRGKSRLSGRPVKVPADISSAAFFLVAAALLKDSRLLIKNLGINPFRDAILQVLQEMGQAFYFENRTGLHNPALEPMVDLGIEGSGGLKAARIYGSRIPSLIDEIPVIAVAAAMAEGETSIRDAKELRVKETDRISVLAGELRKIGVKIEELPDGMIITGGTIIGGEVDSHGDHRLAMSLAVAGLVSQQGVVIHHPDCVNTSFPGFWELLEQVVVR